jgi:metal-sulfur cluster biosynthetic enzyme
MNDDWDRHVRAVLESVPDPCSVAAGASVSLADMGLVRGWEVSPEGDVDILLDVTSPVCLMAGHFVAELQTQLEKIPDLGVVTVRIDPSGTWSPERISDRGRALLAARHGPDGGQR